MINKVFSIRDLKIEAYLQPFMAPTVGAAVRSVQDALSDASTALAKHPEDYQLFHLADFNDETGVYTPIIPSELINQCSDLTTK